MGMLQPINLVAYLIFGVVGFCAFNYGRKLQLWKPIAIGLALMLYGIFSSSPWWQWGGGTALCILLWFHHDE
jgi:hypothetical protein